MAIHYPEILLGALKFELLRINAMLADDSRTKYDARAAAARCWVRGGSIRLRCNYQDVGSSTPLMGRVTPHLCHLSIAIASPDTAAGG